MLRQQIEDQIKESLKSGNRPVLETLRFLFSAIKNAEIDLHHEATDEEVVAVIQKQVKQHKESVEAYKTGGRPELAAKEENELQTLSKFLPEQMSEDQLRSVVEEVVKNLSESDKNNFGKVMGAVMGRVKGKVEGGLVSKVVKEVLSS